MKRYRWNYKKCITNLLKLAAVVGFILLIGYLNDVEITNGIAPR